MCCISDRTDHFVCVQGLIAAGANVEECCRAECIFYIAVSMMEMLSGCTCIQYGGGMIAQQIFCESFLH